MSTAVDETHADLVIADGGLSPRPARTLEDKVGMRVVARTALILVERPLQQRGPPAGRARPRLLGPVPYVGGDLEAEIGLFSVASAD